MEATSILTKVTAIVTEGMSWLGSAATAVTSNDLLLTFTCIGLVGTGVGLLRRIVG